MRRSYEIMGVNFTDQPFATAIEQMGHALTGPNGQTVFFANAATLNIACVDAAYRQVLNSASLMFGDGTGVRWAARLRGVSLQANLNGTDLIPRLIQANEGIRVYMLGGQQDMVVSATRHFPKLFPNATLAGWHNGYFAVGESDRVIAEINAAKADLLLVGFGNPYQESWIAAHQSQLRVPLIAGVGGLFAYWAGDLHRAPEVYRRSGFEWLHIMLMQPRKLRRYMAGNPLFLFRMIGWLRRDLLAKAERKMSERLYAFMATISSVSVI